jgi:hypothetical protein
LITVSPTIALALGSKLLTSADAACSNSACALASVGISPEAGYFAAIYRQIARVSYRMNPSSSYSTSTLRSGGKKEATHDVGDLPERLLREVFGALVFALVEFNLYELEGDLELVQDRGDASRAGRLWVTVELEDRPSASER